MDSDKLAALALAFPNLAATATPGVAQACPGYYEPCLDYDFWQDLAVVNATKIPSDGVVVLQGTHQGDDAQSLPTIELTVTKDGQPLAGALEATSLHGVLVWRPSEAWEAGATYALAGTVTNPPESADCAPMMVAIEAMLNIDVAPGAALGAVAFTGESEVQNSSNVSLATLACCEGATPYSGYSGCSGSGVYWDPNECAPTQATGYLSVQIEGQRRQSLAIRWLLTSARNRPGKTMADKLANELLDAYNGTGATIKRREDTHRMAEANRAFSHYRY